MDARWIDAKTPRKSAPKSATMRMSMKPMSLMEAHHPGVRRMSLKWLVAAAPRFSSWLLLLRSQQRSRAGVPSLTCDGACTKRAAMPLPASLPLPLQKSMRPHQQDNHVIYVASPYTHADPAVRRLRPLGARLGGNSGTRPDANDRRVLCHRRHIAWLRYLTRIVAAAKDRVPLSTPRLFTGLAQPYPVCRSLDGGHVVRARCFPVLVVVAWARSMQ